ncbi:MAG: polysaccharide pyruvyl transferase family protein, partial [Planctomycetota bacterium]
MKSRVVNHADLNEFLTSLSQADLVAASGGGYITDVFENDAMRFLSVLDIAIQSGKPTALFGHGIGPLRSPRLLTKAKTVLPFVDLIALREKRAGLPILESLGVASDRVTTTGDDAIELAYEARTEKLGTKIG